MSALASPIIKQLEVTYARLRRSHPDLPEDIVFVMGMGKTRAGIKLGHFAQGRWTAKDAKGTGGVSEVLISAECLAEGGAQVMQTLVHESVHALAAARGVKDTSRQNRYHNKRFVELAEELGMEYLHDGPHPTIGMSSVTLTEESQERWAKAIAKFDEVIQVAKDAGLDLDADDEPKKPRTVVCVVFDDGGDEVELTEKMYEKLEGHLHEHEAHYEER